MLATVQIAHADDLKMMARSMSQQSFTLLKSLNAQSHGGSSNALLGPVASFASDSEELSRALAKNDSGAAAHAAATLRDDSAAIDNALAAHPEALAAGGWNPIKQQLAAITKQLPSVEPAPGSATIASGISAHVSAPPQIHIDSRTTTGNGIRIKGYLRGTALKSAGIYEAGRRLRAFKVNDIPGEQKLDFEIALGSPGPDTTIRVSDADGRFAEATVLDPMAAVNESSSAGREPASNLDVSALPAPGSPPLNASAPGSMDSSIASTEHGVEVFRGSDSDGDSETGTPTKEIPSHGTVRPSPSKRKNIGGQLGGVQINILGVTQTQTLPPTYEVIGQISGRGIARAGIYLDGRLVKKIPVEHGGSYISFDQRFIMNGGEATIRAYGVGSQFVESSIDVSSGPGSIGPGVPMASAGLSIQITAVRQITPNLYAVAGVISGRNIASAGLYQNGMLVQNLNLGGGIAGMLGALIPGGYRNANFNAQFNPGAGQTSIRAFDTAGAYAEQPVMAGMNPYGYGTTPYAGVSPFGVPVNPYYGAPPTNPYMANPYSRPRTPNTRPLW
jgi:hypothetical protein